MKWRTWEPPFAEGRLGSLRVAFCLRPQEVPMSMFALLLKHPAKGRAAYLVSMRVVSRHRRLPFRSGVVPRTPFRPTDFLGDQDPGQFTPRTMRFAIWVNMYDCAKQLKHLESSELHMVDGTVRSDNRPSSEWYPALIPAADPVFGYVCQWKGK